MRRNQAGLKALYGKCGDSLDELHFVLHGSSEVLFFAASRNVDSLEKLSYKQGSCLAFAWKPV